MEDAPAPGLVERVDHLTAAVADLGFKLETLISSTTAFRESFGERMTDYADLVAHWSIETEDNLAKQRQASERLVADLHRAVDSLAENLAAAVAKVERRVLEAIEADDRGHVDLEPIVEEVRALRRDVARLPDDAGQADALAAVLAEVTAARQELPGVIDAIVPPAVDIGPVAEEVRSLRQALLAEASAAEEDDTTLAEAVGAELAGLRAEMKALQKKVAERPPVPPEVEALTAELQALRREMEAEPAEPAEAQAPSDSGVQDILAELVYEVKALRRRFPVKPLPEEPATTTATAAAAPAPAEPPPVPPKRSRRRQ